MPRRPRPPASEPPDPGSSEFDNHRAGLPRPGLLAWFKYAFGGKLADRYDDWVLADLTGPDWRIREAGRIMLFAVIPVIVLLLLPGPLEIRIYAALFVVIGPLFVGFAYGDELRDRRLRQHGLLPPNGPDIF